MGHKNNRGKSCKERCRIHNNYDIPVCSLCYHTVMYITCFTNSTNVKYANTMRQLGLVEENQKHIYSLKKHSTVQFTITHTHPYTNRSP